MSTEFDFVRAEHFFPAPDHAAAQALFKDSVTMVEIEIFSYCNRRCWFCPNSEIDRISEKKFLPADLYLNILRQLREIDYSGTISFSRYNEPLADKIILERIRQASETLPKARIHTNTNGDYLNPGYLGDLYNAGLRSLNIQVYLQNEERYDHEDMRRKAQFMIGKLGLPSTLVNDIPNEWLHYDLTYRDMSLRLYGRNFEINGCSRGDTLDVRRDFVRTNPCISPFQFVYVDYNGKMVPCCNLRSDVQSHEPYVTHDLVADTDIFAAYAQSPLVKWRQSLVGWKEKGGVCRSCAFPSSLPSPTAEDLAVHEKLVNYVRSAKALP